MGLELTGEHEKVHVELGEKEGLVRTCIQTWGALR